MTPKLLERPHTRTLKRWGGSLGFVIPVQIVRELRLTVSDVCQLTITDDKTLTVRFLLRHSDANSPLRYQKPLTKEEKAEQKRAELERKRLLRRARDLI